ncbi:MAG: site-specific DNA-methyltransferase [Cytophagales bacterium]|nr:site-specific DNA-methyltransferase [Cytophagales bacterium]
MARIIGTSTDSEQRTQCLKGKDEYNNFSEDLGSLLSNTIVHGDVMEVLKSVPDESFHLTFTSPPYYNARPYSTFENYETYLSFLEDFFRVLHSKTKEGRFFVLNTSPVIEARLSRQHASKRYPIPFDLHPRIQKHGWEYIDDIIWVKPEYSAKNRVGGFAQHRKPLGYKPNIVTEYLFVYRKQTDKLIDWNIRSYPKDVVDRSKVREDYETTNVWHINPTHNKHHPAVFPEELCKRVIRYYSMVGDLVFDPFGGSGVLARMASVEGRSFFLTERNGDYFQYMKNTLERKLFEDVNFQTLSEFESRVISGE